jgi:hypothetical protein
MIVVLELEDSVNPMLLGWGYNCSIFFDWTKQF